MTHEELRTAIELIAGGKHHGMMKAAANALEVSNRTIHRAYRNHNCSKKLELKIKLMAKAAANRSEKKLSMQAGSWSVGHVENRQGGTDVVDESVVLHLAHPSFVVHVEMLRGKAADGGPIFKDARVRWYDLPKDDGQRDTLLKIAQEKGRDAIYDRLNAVAEIEMRKHHMNKAKKNSPLEENDLIGLSSLALSAEAEGVDVWKQIEKMNEEIELRIDILGGNVCRSTIDLGKWMLAHDLACITTHDTDQSFLPSYICAKAYRLLPQEHYNTKRGMRVNVGSAVHDRVIPTKNGGITSPNRVDRIAEVQPPPTIPERHQKGGDRAKVNYAVNAHLEAYQALKHLTDDEKAMFDYKLEAELSHTS